MTVEAKITPSTALVWRGEYLHGNFRNVPCSVIVDCLEQERNLVLIDQSAGKKEILPGFILESYIKGVDDLHYKKVDIPVDPDKITWDFDAYTSELLHRFHPEWYNSLHDYLHSETFKGMMRTIRAQRDAGVAVYPKSEQVFRTFLQPLERIKSVWVGLSPYPSYEHATGIPFQSYSKTKPPSLRVLEEGIKNSCAYDDNWKLPSDLVPLSNKGIWFYNIALTTTSEPESHVNIWKPFTNKIIEVLNNKSDISWILFGKKASELKKQINPAHQVYELPHPAYYARNGGGYDTSVFSEVFSSLNIVEKDFQ